MREWIKQHKWNLIIFFVVFVLAIPLAINIAFQHVSPVSFLHAEWEAGDALGFYGSLVSAGVAVYGVFLSIQYAQKNYREDVRNRSLPFITIDLLKIKLHKTMFTDNSLSNTQEEHQEGYHEYKLQDYYCILKDGKITYTTGLTKEQQKLLDNGGMKWCANSSGGSMVLVDEICVPIEIENIGNGSAIHFRYGLNRKSTDEKNRVFLPVITMKTGNPIMLHIFSEDCGKNSPNNGEYVLSFHYEDIFGNRYVQKFDVLIEYDENKRTPVVSVDMNHKQEILEGKNNG